MTITKQMIEERPLSFSSLKEFMKSPSHYIQYLTQPKEETDAMLFGGMAHTLALEPDEFEKKYLVMPQLDRRKKEDKAKADELEAQAASEGKTAVTTQMFLNVKEIVGSLVQSPNYQYILRAINKEQEFRETHSTGLKVRGFIDAELPDYNIELKFMQSCDYDDVMREFYKNKYHVQAGIYNWANGKPMLYIVCEKSKPYLSRVFEAHPDFTSEGKELFEKSMEQFKYCMDVDGFSAGYEFHYGSEPVVLSLPPWAKKGAQND